MMSAKSWAKKFHQFVDINGMADGLSDPEII
jgi:hypothetical protein